jgi:hypothetical protein
MEDVKRLTEGSASVEKIRNRGSGERIAFRASTGMFRSRKDSQPTKEEAQTAIVDKITEIDEQGSSVLERILDNQIASATTPASQPLLDKLGNVLMVDGKPLTFTDSKTMMASAKASQVVLKAAGLEQPAREEKKSFEVRIVNIGDETFKMLMERQNGMIQEDLPRRPMQPSFIDAEEVYTNPAPTKPAPSQPVGRTEKATESKLSFPKESVSTQWLSNENDMEIQKLTSGVSMSVVQERAAHSTDVLRITKLGKVISGAIHLADALCRSAETVAVEVVPD